MKYGIVGANSYIGRHVALSLLRDKQFVKLYDVDLSSKDGLNNYQKIDFNQPDTLAAIAEEIEVIYFFTGLTGTETGFDQFEKFIDVNEKTLLHLLNLFRARKSKARIIFPSSRLVYKGRNNTPLKEDDEKEPKTIYAVNKLCCEQYLQIYQECFGINYSVARICIPYGNLLDSTYSYGTIGFMLARARDGRDISIYGDGCQRRSFIHIEDLANMLVSVGSDPRTRGEILNIGGPDAMSILEAATLIANKYNVKITYADWPALESKIETGDTMFDSGKIENLLNYQYKHRFQEWVKTFA